VPIELALLEQSALLCPREHVCPRLLLRETGELPGVFVHPPLGPDHHRLGQAVRAADLEVGRVVSRRHLERARAELGLHAFVGDDGDPSFDERDDHLAPDEVAIAVVLRVHGDRDVREDGRRSDGRDRHVPVAVGERVAREDELVVRLDAVELEIGERRRVERAPVDDPVVAVEPPALPQVDEMAHHRPLVALVHGHPLAAVVHGGAHTPELRHDRPPVAAEPVPDDLHERLATHVLPRRAFPLEGLLDDGLRGDARVVVARLEEAVVALHPLPANQRVGQRQPHRVPHVQLTRHVGRRVRVDIRRPVVVGLGAVEALLLPVPLPALLDALRVVAGLHQAILDATSRGEPPTVRSNPVGANGPQVRSGSDYALIMPHDAA
jgi:hypothetical protein